MTDAQSPDETVRLRPNIPRALLGVILATLLLGQALMLQEAGLFSEHQDLYQLAAVAAITLALWSYIEWVLAVGIKVVASAVKQAAEKAHDEWVEQ